MEVKEIGKWAFLIGIVLAILSAFTANIVAPSIMVTILFLLGLVVGFLNISRKSSATFLISVLILLVLGVGGISALSGFSFLGIYDYLAAMFSGFVTFVGAAALIVAIKIILDTNEGILSAIKVNKKRKE